MSKKLVSDWRVALIFFFFGNILATIPTFIFFRLVPLFPGNMWVRLVISLIGSLALFYLGFNLSGKFISNYYVIRRRRGIIGWAVGYLIVINTYLWLSKYSKDILSLPSAVTLFGLLMFAVVLVVFVPRSLLIASKEEIDEAERIKSSKHKKLAERIGMVLGYVFSGLGLDAFLGIVLGLVVGNSLDKTGWLKDLVFLFQSVVVVVFVVWLFRATLTSKRFAWMAGIISVGLQAILFTVVALISGTKGLNLYITILYLPLYLLAPVFVPRLLRRFKGDRPL